MPATIPLPVPCTRAQAVAALGERGLRTALNSGWLTRIWRNLFVPVTRAHDPRTRARAALLLAGPEAALSGPTAAEVYGWTPLTSSAVHVTVPYSRWAKNRPGLVVHHDRFTPEDVVVLDDLRVLAPEYVLADLLCGRAHRAGFACADQAFRSLPQGLQEELRREIDTRLRARDDPRGVRRALLLLELATGLPESPAESLMLLTLVLDGQFPIPDLQHEILDLDGRVVCRLDFAWTRHRIALEYDGFEAHESRAEQDADRDERMAGRGWITVRAGARDLRSPEALFERLRAAFARRERPT
ncbi:hypothetical protein [Crossiella sp. CA198]|uniref:hypothetical protein n=1 Tax=Crossiella sp. CA198 TaxID=3455607 RepID=UPI003F8D8BF8